MLPYPWPVIGSVLSGIGTVVLLGYLWRYRGKPSADWFLLTLFAQATWCFSYGLSLLVFDPAVRWAFEVVTWIAMAWIGLTFLAFSLEYTGRRNAVHTVWFGVLTAVPAVTTLLVVTNPAHELVWSGFAIDPVFEVATTSYEFETWAYVAIVVGMLYAVWGTFLLFDTVVSYGPLYRSEALAVVLSTLPPGVALLVWLFELGPVTQLSLVPIAFLPHVLLDAYAFVGGNMFTYSPATRRTAEKSAIEELEIPFVVVDTNCRIVDLNLAAEREFDVAAPSVLGDRLESTIDLDVELTGGDRIVTDDGAGEFRELAVSTSKLRDSSDTLVGYTVLLQDITDQRQREQRLEILNRILRHNFRNDLNVVEGYVDIAAERADEEELREVLARARADITSVIAMAEKAWSFERALEEVDESDTTVAVFDVFAEIAADVEASTDGRVEVAVPEDLLLWTRRGLFVQLFENLVENGIEHADCESATVSVEFEGIEDDRLAVFSVEDDGPGIPGHELAVIERGEETALEHGSGLGLWLATWCVRSLGGTMAFDTDDGTTVTVRLPTVAEPIGPTAGEADDDRRRSPPRNRSETGGASYFG
ncbi:histidine kinase N-terminal 7TM domain-containing protein [Natrarchaeobius chitinivorans]|uniref:histidine kinase n=1 Tax=Natrarchaeobius chitinivorans TaxID=1679083 RepID=A0A3N6M3J4_NATCH|nr:histidine kinase N-terminal 7TM domain-containing protein [Natrarchaeobius chitinivorans]RQG98043.1 HTR-like protein [Natrarchaeobius chitinivorans]